MSDLVYTIIAIGLFPIIWPITICILNRIDGSLEPSDDENTEFLWSAILLFMAILCSLLWMVTLPISMLVGIFLLLKKPLIKFTGFVTKIQKILSEK